MRRHFTQLSVLFLALSSVACSYDNDGKTRVDATASSDTSYASIDTGATMSNIASGVGFFVEYTAGGIWKVQFACDTATTGLDCLWDVLAYTPGGGRIYESSQSTDSADVVTVASNGEVRMVMQTTTEVDEVDFMSDKGQPVTFDVLLDGEAAPNRFVFWMSGGKVVQGADTTVVQLTPTTP